VTAKARRTDPRTSHEAARSLGNLSDKQAAVLEVLDEGGDRLFTDEDLIDAYRARHGHTAESTVRTRRGELTDAGFIEVVDAGGTSRAGNRCQRFRRTTHGGPR